MYATSNSARPPAARSLAAVWTELPSTYFTVAPVAFSKAAAWHFFEFSTKVPPKVATTRSSALAGRAGPAVSRHSSEMLEMNRHMVMSGGSSPGVWVARLYPTLDGIARAEEYGTRREGRGARHVSSPARKPGGRHGGPDRPPDARPA